MKHINDEKSEMEAIEKEVVAFFNQREDYPKAQEEHWQRGDTPRWSRRFLLLVGLLCIVFGSMSLILMGVLFMKPEMEKPQIVAERVRLPISSIEREEDRTIPGAVRNKGMEEKPLEGGMSGQEKPTVSKAPESSMVGIPRGRLDERVVIIGGVKIKQDEKTQADGRPNKNKLFGQEIVEEDIKIKEKIPRTISMREESTAAEIEEKSLEEKSQPRPITSDTVELERRKEPMEAISPETPELEEKPVGFRRGEGKAEENRREKIEVKTAKIDLKDDGTTPSPVKTPSPLVKSETAITPQESIRQPNQLNPMVQSKPPSFIAREEEVRQFLADYAERYTQKDIDGFLLLFSPKAVQNQRDRFDKIKKIYSDFFDKSQVFQYDIEDTKIEIYQNGVEVRGRYKLVQIGKKGRKKRVWSGDIYWVLVRENGALRIRFLDFRPQRSP
jgi:hypothetical protein